ncbi:MAG: hypothetical protein LBJ69_00905 [Holosporales bacterium]|nr:hypothetical protein [Holosporales bacterium]
MKAIVSALLTVSCVGVFEASSSRLRLPRGLGEEAQQTAATEARLQAVYAARNPNVSLAQFNRLREDMGECFTKITIEHYRPSNVPEVGRAVCKMYGIMSNALWLTPECQGIRQIKRNVKRNIKLIVLAFLLLNPNAPREVLQMLEQGRDPGLPGLQPPYFLCGEERQPPGTASPQRSTVLTGIREITLPYLDYIPGPGPYLPLWPAFHPSAPVSSGRLLPTYPRGAQAALLPDEDRDQRIVRLAKILAPDCWSTSRDDAHPWPLSQYQIEEAKKQRKLVLEAMEPYDPE